MWPFLAGNFTLGKTPSIATPGDEIQFDTLSTGSGLLPPGLYTEVEALHLSRGDNPYIQKISSQDHLDDYLGSEIGSFARYASQSLVSGSHSLMSPEPPYSPTKSCDALTLSELHSHLVRSPPPVNWPTRELPLSPRSNGTFSPDSSDGLESSEYNGNCYMRSQSEEHILSPCRDLLKAGLFSPVRGTTPELMTMSMGPETLACHFTSPKNPREAKIRRNYTCNLSTEDTLSPTRRGCEGKEANQFCSTPCPCKIDISFTGGTTPSFSTYTMLSASSRQNGEHTRRGYGGRTLGGKRSTGDNFFSTWRSQRCRRSSDQHQDAKSMESLQVDFYRMGGGFSPGTRKSICSFGGGGMSPRNAPLTFTRFRSSGAKNDPDLLFIPWTIMCYILLIHKSINSEKK